jgi:hypothetical protein
MASLAETNPYIRDPERRRRLLEENALDSSVFEGARGLKAALQPQFRPHRCRPATSRKKEPHRFSDRLAE